VCVSYLKKSIKLIAIAAPLSVKRSDKRDMKILTQAKLKKFLYTYLIQGGLKVRNDQLSLKLLVLLGKCFGLKL